jgi:hypothetical protein
LGQKEGSAESEDSDGRASGPCLLEREGFVNGKGYTSCRRLSLRATACSCGHCMGRAECSERNVGEVVEVREVGEVGSASSETSRLDLPSNEDEPRWRTSTKRTSTRISTSASSPKRARRKSSRPTGKSPLSSIQTRSVPLLRARLAPSLIARLLDTYDRTPTTLKQVPPSCPLDKAESLAAD